jgi:hypothetical protein
VGNEDVRRATDLATLGDAEHADDRDLGERMAEREAALELVDTRLGLSERVRDICEPDADERVRDRRRGRRARGECFASGRGHRPLRDPTDDERSRVVWRESPHVQAGRSSGRAGERRKPPCLTSCDDKRNLD